MISLPQTKANEAKGLRNAQGVTGVRYCHRGPTCKQAGSLHINSCLLPLMHLAVLAIPGKGFLITKIPNTKFCLTRASSVVAVYPPTLYTSPGTYGLLCNKCLLGTANICVCLATLSRSILMTDNNCHVHDIFRQLKIKPICSSSLKVRGKARSFPLLSE